MYTNICPIIRTYYTTAGPHSHVRFTPTLTSLPLSLSPPVSHTLFPTCSSLLREGIVGNTDGMVAVVTDRHWELNAHTHTHTHTHKPHQHTPMPTISTQELHPHSAARTQTPVCTHICMHTHTHLHTHTSAHTQSKWDKRTCKNRENRRAMVETRRGSKDKYIGRNMRRGQSGSNSKLTWSEKDRTIPIELIPLFLCLFQCCRAEFVGLLELDSNSSGSGRSTAQNSHQRERWLWYSVLCVCSYHSSSQPVKVSETNLTTLQILSSLRKSRLFEKPTLKVYWKHPPMWDRAQTLRLSL